MPVVYEHEGYSQKEGCYLGTGRSVIQYWIVGGVICNTPVNINNNFYLMVYLNDKELQCYRYLKYNLPE